MFRVQQLRHILHNPCPGKFPHFPTFQTRFHSISTSILNLCRKPQHLRQIHARFFLHGLHQNSILSSKLIDCYANFGLLGISQKIFNSTENPDSVLYNAILRSLSRFGEHERSLWVYHEMVKKSMYPDQDSYAHVLRSGFCLSDEHGKTVHGHIVKLGVDAFDSVGSTLMEMYDEGDVFLNGCEPFLKQDIMELKYWNDLISEASQCGKMEESFQLFSRMRKERLQSNSVTIINLLRSAVDLNSLKLGRLLHSLVVVSNLCKELSVSTALLSMYAKLGSIEDARLLFEKMSEKDCVVWNITISAYSQNRCPEESLQLLSCMVRSGVRADLFTAIPACANIGALEYVRYLHGHSLKVSLDSLTSVKTSLLTSYAKCGCIEMARKLFDEEKSSHKDLIAWNSMISAYAKHGEWFQCFQLYNQMKLSSIIPDRVTFLGLLTACVNSGLVKEGKDIFMEMMEIYGYHPSQEHHACMVDLLGRAGHIDEAREIIKTMPFKPDARVWGPLLSACKMHSETQFAEFAADNLINMEPKNAGNYILLSNIYAAAGKWDGVAKMRSILRDRGLRKTPGCSWLELNGKVHEFRVADQSHPSSKDIYTALKILELETSDLKDNKVLETLLTTPIF